MTSAPAVEVYDQDGNYVEVAKVSVKPGGTVVVDVVLDREASHGAS